MHLAAAVGTPCVALFAARNIPRVWYPFGPRHRILYHQVDCAGCSLETCIVEKKKCLLSITPDEVLTELAAVLTPNP
jgi:ADP-heptose:LPS heptosyltransferase